MNEQHLRNRQQYHHEQYLLAQNYGDYKLYSYHLKEYENITEMLNEWLRSCEG